MDLRSRLNAVLSSFAHPCASPVVQVDGQTACCVLVANAFMRRSQKVSGAQKHYEINRLLGAGVCTERELRSWMREFFPDMSERLWETCRRRADKFLQTGVKVFRWSTPKNFPAFEKQGREDFFSGPIDGEDITQSSTSPCPVLYGKGGLGFELPLFAVFNSRKPRLISPHSNWLKALAFFFRSLDPRQIALAASAGTLTYDMASAHALRSGLPQLLVAPFPLLSADRELLKTYGEGANNIPLLSCMLDTASCCRRQAQVCRDRILGALAHLHLVLEIRSRGNLSAVLENIQAKSPRPQFILEPEDHGSSSAGNYALLKKFSGHAHGFRPPRTLHQPAANPVRTHRPSNMGNSSPHDDIIRGNYLYHYTRARAGPWPGETYREYLLNLLDECPLSGYSALDTLIRILQEGLIRAGSKMVRGEEAVISWSSHPPDELFEMRKWNRTLARWTVEPYGIAVRRDILRSFAAKPAIYGDEQVYSRLAEPERYRFQLSRSGGSASWRHEREWRVRGGLELSKIKPDGGFVFVPTEEEKEELCRHVKSRLPIVVFGA